MTAHPPLAVHIIRGPAVESRHQVHAVLMDGAGRIKSSYGDAARLTFPRSTLKPLQALALMESDAPEVFGMSDAEVALACASHSGEERHTSAVKAWLQRLGLDEVALECGSHAPYGAPCLTGFNALHNNCSGKHAGMLTLALFLKVPISGYTTFDHPVQKAILAKMSEICDTALTPAVCGVDGCSAPNPAMPLQNLARGFASFMRGDKPSHRRIFTAMAQYPELVGGTQTERLDTVLMRAAGGKIVSKTGAEGVYIALLPEHDTAIVLKAEDGATRAAQAALHGLLEKHALANEAVLNATRPLALPILKNWRGIETGKTEVT